MKTDAFKNRFQAVVAKEVDAALGRVNQAMHEIVKTEVARQDDMAAQAIRETDAKFHQGVRAGMMDLYIKFCALDL